MGRWGLLALFAIVALGARADFEVYFLRHGETFWNRAKILQGSVSDTMLTRRGVRMAERTAEGLRRSGVRFDRIYASPYRRAKETADVIARAYGLESVPEPRLREMCFGRYEGLHYEKGRYADDNLRLFFESPERYVPQGANAESFAQVGRRLRDFLEGELAPLDGKVGRVLCVAHSLVLKSLLRELFGDTLPAAAKAPIQRNCCVHVLRYSRGKFELKEASRIFYDPAEFESASRETELFTVRYADGSASNVGDLHLPANLSASTELVLQIHGGGWTKMSRQDASGISRRLAERGYAVYNIDYRLASPGQPWPACAEDCLAAARFLLNGGVRAYGLQPQSIWIMGASAGGHLALWTGFHLPREQVRGVISVSGIADAVPDAEAHPGRYQGLFGGRTPSAEEIASVSLLPFAARPGPRVLQTHAREDTVVPIASARNFAEAYRRNGGDVTLCDYSRDDEPNCGGHCIWPKDVQPMRARLLLLLEKAIDDFMKGSR